MLQSRHCSSDRCLCNNQDLKLVFGWDDVQPLLCTSNEEQATAVAELTVIDLMTTVTALRSVALTLAHSLQKQRNRRVAIAVPPKLSNERLASVCIDPVLAVCSKQEAATQSDAATASSPNIDTIVELADSAAPPTDETASAHPVALTAWLAAGDTQDRLLQWIEQYLVGSKVAATQLTTFRRFSKHNEYRLDNPATGCMAKYKQRVAMQHGPSATLKWVKGIWTIACPDLLVKR